MIMSAYELNNFIFMAARLPQILSNYKVSAHTTVVHISVKLLYLGSQHYQHLDHSCVFPLVLGCDWL